MPRYFFDIHDGQDAIDQEGIEYPDDDAALAEAISAAGAMVREATIAMWGRDPWTMQVRDDTGSVIAQLAFTAFFPSRTASGSS